MSEVIPGIDNKHTEYSSYREKLVEHLFVAELLKISWTHHNCILEVARPEVDNAGCDLIAEVPGVVRHIQLKTSKIDGSTPSQKVHLRLANKPSGCVVWIYFDEKSMRLGPFLFYGSHPGQPLLNLDQHKVAKHTKGNKDGFKAQRPNIRVLPKAVFTKLDSIDAVYAQLFLNN